MNDYIKSLVDAKKLDISLKPNRWEFDSNPYIISGPCSVESEEMIVDWAHKMKDVGVNAMSLGAKDLLPALEQGIIDAAESSFGEGRRDSCHPGLPISSIHRAQGSWERSS